MVGSYTNVFSGATVKPSFPSYQAITLSASIALLWPTESQEGATYVATQIDVTPASAGLSIAMPSAFAGSLGPATLISNIGAIPFNLTDASGNLIVTISTTQSWWITLTSNSSTNGTWRTLQLGSTTSTAQASLLADNLTIQATVNNTLQTMELTNTYTTSTLLVAGNRGTLNILAVGSGISTFTFDLIANLTVGWWCEIQNLSGNTLTLGATSGQIIQGSNTVVAGGSAKVVVGAASITVIDNLSQASQGNISLALVQAMAVALG